MPEGNRGAPGPASPETGDERTRLRGVSETTRSPDAPQVDAVLPQPVAEAVALPLTTPLVGRASGPGVLHAAESRPPDERGATVARAAGNAAIARSLEGDRPAPLSARVP